MNVFIDAEPVVVGPNHPSLKDERTRFLEKSKERANVLGGSSIFPGDTLSQGVGLTIFREQIERGAVQAKGGARMTIVVLTCVGYQFTFEADRHWYFSMWVLPNVFVAPPGAIIPAENLSIERFPFLKEHAD